MTFFFDLFARRARSPEAWADPHWADRQLPKLLAGTPLRLWAPVDPVSDRGVRLLVGVATWSGYDMRLLDVMAEGLLRGRTAVSDVDIFNTADCQRHADFRRYIPKLRTVLQMPVAGVWVSGQLNWAGQGAEARDHVAQMFGSSSTDIVNFVMDWINAQRDPPHHESSQPN